MQKNIRRITVDEKLDENLFRVLISELNPHVSIQDISSLEGWSDEKEILLTNSPLTSKNINNLEFYTEWSNLTRKLNPKILPKWESLKEGQVFISGFYRFKKKKKKVFIQRDKDQFLFHRIDLIPQLKDYVKQLYFSVLRSDRDDISNRER